MKISYFLLIFSIFYLNAANINSQNAQITLNKQNVRLSTILSEIEEQTDYLFVYDKKVDMQQNFSININSKNLWEVLQQLFTGTNISFTTEGSNIILKVVSQQPTQDIRRKILGTVKETNGEPVIGASIMVTGTSVGTVTDINGDFTLALPDDAETLSVSYIGMKPIEITLTSSPFYDVMMEEDVMMINEVVVTALGIKRSQKALTYNVQEINQDALVLVKDANFINTLAGKIAGVTINSSSSGIGGSSKVVMRGTKSISGNNNALYVIDGIPMPSLATTQPSDLFTGMGQSGDGAANINPDDIESISVLTGSAAAALYGSEAANGVVLITTKKGELDKDLSIRFSNNTQFSSPFVIPKFQNTYGSETGSFSSWGEKLETPSSYNPLDFFQTGYSMTNSLSLSTGTRRNITYLSVASLMGEGIIPNNELSRLNISANNSNFLFDDRLKLDLNVMYMSIKEGNMLAQGQYFNPLIPLYLFPRGDDIAKYQTFERYDIERNFKTQYWPYGNMGLGMQNPFWIVNRDNFQNKKDRFLLGAGLKYDINDNVNVSTRVKMDYNKSVFEKKYAASTDGIFADKYGFYAHYNDQTRQVYADVLLNFDRYFGDFSVTSTIGASLSDIRYNYSGIEGDLNSVANLFSLKNISLNQSQTDQKGYHDQLQALFGTAQLGYKSFLFLELTARNDWSSTFPNSIFYPSVGLSSIWTDILQIDSSILSLLKTRLSYSEVGNAPQRYITRQYYELENATPETVTFMFNDNLQPERTKSWEAGLDLSLLNRKVSMGGSLYQSATSNQLFMPTLPSSSGYDRIYVNAGKVENKGVEFRVGTDLRLGSVGWNSSLVYSMNRNKIIQLLREYTLPTGDVISITKMNMGGTDSYRMELHEGGSMGDFYVTTLKTDEHGYIVVDQSSQEVISDPNTFIYGGNVNPKYNLGFSNSFAWKNLNLGFLINARVGGEVTSATQAVMDAYGVSVASAEARDNGGAIVNGQKIPAQPYFQTIGGGRSGVGSMYVYSATNVRMAELSLGYNIPLTGITESIQSMYLSLTGRNLFMFYNKAPFDPELTASTGTYYQGIDYFMAPSLRNIGFSIKLTF